MKLLLVVLKIVIGTPLVLLGAITTVSGFTLFDAAPILGGLLILFAGLGLYLIPHNKKEKRAI